MPRRDRCGNFTVTGATERSDKERSRGTRAKGATGREAVNTSRPVGQLDGAGYGPAAAGPEGAALLDAVVEGEGGGAP